MTTTDPTREFAEALMATLEPLEPVLDAVRGYQAQLEPKFGEALSKRMAADYHAGLMRMVLK